MAKPGQNKGNQNAALRPGARHKRVNFTVSLSGDRLQHLIDYLKVTGGDTSEPTDREIAAEARRILEAWIDALQI